MQVEFGLFRGCLSYNKINHLLRTCPPDLLEDALGKFDDHFQSMVADILRVGCLAEDQWEQASLPVRLSGRGEPNESNRWLGLRLVAQLLGRMLPRTNQMEYQSCWLLTKRSRETCMISPVCAQRSQFRSFFPPSGTKTHSLA